jgi:hypothetical protein
VGLVVVGCSARSQARTESRMAPALGFSIASRFTFGREGEASEGV